MLSPLNSAPRHKNAVAPGVWPGMGMTWTSSPGGSISAARSPVSGAPSAAATSAPPPNSASCQWLMRMRVAPPSAATASASTVGAL
jgi:hypothetical protein